ncbi:MAG TPA: MG2 domain-containing protein [Bacteroidales bacterium]|nr:MG2 domain-containing protein [Bacteroidales bacterium]
MKTPLTHRLLRLCLAFLLVISFSTCGEKKLKPIYIDPAFAEYIISFTSGVISSASPIRVRMVQEQASAVAGEELKDNPFDFSPNIEGKAVWIDNQTIEFIPEKRLPAGEIYTVDFALHSFVEVPKNLRVLTFRFQVMKQAIEYSFNGIEPYKISEKKWQKIHGIYTTADVTDNAELEKAVTAKANGKQFKISWQHSKDGKTHNFTIDSVERKQSPEMIQLTCKAKAIGIDETFTERIEMPALQDFKVLHVKTTTNPQTIIDIFFSDPLNSNQDITGLFILEPSANERVTITPTGAKMFLGKSVTGDVKLTIQAGLQNSFGANLKKDYVTTLKFVSMKPEVSITSEGNIIPNTNGVFFHFNAVSLKAVDVTIIKIFENNIPQFLQVNQLDGDRELKRVGRIVYNQEMPLISEKPIDYGTWNTFTLDLSQLIEPEPGAIYRVEIGFRKKHSLYPCSETDSKEEEETYKPQKDINADYDAPERSYWDYYDDEYEYEYYDYNWYDRENPCKNSYYMYNNRKVVRNILASDFGIVAKAGTNNEYFVTVSDLRTTEPLSGIEIEFRNYQNQVLAKTKTNGDGMCKIKLENKPFLLVAKKDKQRGYLRVDDASSLSLSMFDVKGDILQKGVKGFIYGERGVWRPGDSLYLTFILEDKNKSLPPNHPVIFELYNPENQLSQRIVKSINTNGFYSFRIQTPADAPTGNWTAKCKVGNSTFSKTLKIETVKPNRMKINLTYPSKILRNGVSEKGSLQVNWLHGVPARNAKVKIEATLAPAKTTFEGYKDYCFDDPSVNFETQEFTVFEGTVDDEGKATVHTDIDVANNTPGMVNVQLKTRAFESGGDFSTDRFVMPYSPYTAYVGIKMPEGKGWNNALYSDEKNIIPIALVDQNGKPLNRKLKIEIYEIYWRWWWDMSEEENLADYISNQHSNLIKTDYVTTKQGKAMYEMNLGGNYWGRKFIRVYDEESEHSTGATFYTTYKSWWSNAGNENPGGAEMLMFNTDKKAYTVGDKVTVELPATHSGRALVSIETGSKVLQNFWIEPTKDNSKFSFTVTPEMSPNVYIHISYIQAHNTKNNDFPIRMYGVQAIKIDDPATRLQPVIQMSKELKPEQKFSVKVKEASGKPMTYTIAIVDDGILDLTRFKTPNPWDAFYAQEALGVRTWDMYKYVAGTYTGNIAGLLAIGGDEFEKKKGKENNNRFKPVVLFKGPFTCKAGETKTHDFTMPNYVGSVRVMIVAGNNGAYGKAEQTVPVKQDLMVLPTLPRVISPTEEITIPVTVFAMQPNIKQVQVQLQVDNNITILDGATRSLTFSKPGDKIVEFRVKAKEISAQTKITVVAKSGTLQAKSETNLNIRLPNPPVTDAINMVIKPGETVKKTVEAIGIAGTNSGLVEISRILPVNLENRMQYLIRYPHGCIEQITSAAFPQLFLQSFTEISQERKKAIETNIKAYLEKLKSYQLANGGFGYWPGDSYGANEWGTNYAGHCMVEAKQLGYSLPVGVYDNWLTFQTNEAGNWRSSAFNTGDDAAQAYRLYTLALAKKPHMSAMNRLRETSSISNNAKWLLASTYAMAGKTEVSEKIIQSIPESKLASDEDYYNYGSFERSKAIKLQTYVLLKKHMQAKVLADDLANTLASKDWLSTQTTAYSLMALSKFAGNNSGSSLQYTISIDGAKQNISSNKPLHQTSLDYKQTKTRTISITNTSKQVLYARIQLQGVPLMASQPANAENLSIDVDYFTMEDKPLEIQSLKQGTDFYAIVTIKHPGIKDRYKDMAVQHMFPSGWEILNTRMDEIDNNAANNSTMRYQDIRDDRVYSYFDLQPYETKTYKIMLTTAYLGKFFLPSVFCEAMYDNTIHGRTQGQWIEVKR